MSAIDISEGFIHHAAEVSSSNSKIQYGVASAVHIPFAVAAFDCATSFMCILEMENVLSEISRVLKPSGFVQFSILHPCFNTPHRKTLRDSDGEQDRSQALRYLISNFLPNGTLLRAYETDTKMNPKQGIKH